MEEKELSLTEEDDICLKIYILGTVDLGSTETCEEVRLDFLLTKLGIQPIGVVYTSNVRWSFT